MNRRQKKTLYRIIASFIVLVIATLCSFNDYLQLGLYIVSYLIIGYDVVFSAVRNILHGQVFDENFLMAIATVGAFGIGEYPEAAAVMLFYQVGELFQGIAVGRSRKSIAALMDIRPESATVIRDGEEIEVSPEDVFVDEIIIVKAGEKIALDGIVVEGDSSVNTSALTGESLPIDKSMGDAVISGSVNINGILKIRVTKIYNESTVAKILELVETSYSKKAKSEKFITKFARYYTPVIVICAVILAFVPPLLFGESFSEWINRALIFLVVSCPCALVISVPLSFFGGIGGAAKNGILIKGANYLESVSKLDTVVFDKTGTLSEGVFEVVAIHPEVMPKSELLEIVAIVESYSNHPIAESILRAYGKLVDKSRVSDVHEIAGQGLSAVVDGKKIYTGNAKLMESIGADYHACHLQGTIIHAVVDGVYKGHIVISDKIKANAASGILDIKKENVSQVVMLTGDIKAVGETVAKELNIDKVYTELLPHQKVEHIEKILADEKSGKKVAFVGDGINDAPVLTRADVGIAMGALGSDAAIEAADVVIMDDDISKIATIIQIAKKTISIVTQNIVFCLLIKAVVLVLGAVGIANMWLAILSDVGVMIVAVLNAMRSYFVKVK